MRRSILPQFGRHGTLRNHEDMTLAVGSVGKRCANIFFGQLREISENFFVRHSGRKPSQHVSNGNTQLTDAGPSASLARLNSYNRMIVHAQLNG